jgi:nucleotide-binding universal stress UspA family protein
MYSKIVVGTDGSDRSLIAVDHAARLAAVCAAELHVVAASSPIDAKIGHDASRRHGVRVIEHPQVGDPAVVLMEVADAVDADLIVVGNKRVPSRLAHQAHRPVLIVHTG